MSIPDDKRISADVSSYGSSVIDPNVDIIIDYSQMGRVGRRPALKAYILKLIHLRHFTWAEARGKVKTKHQGFLLGNLWNIASPLLDAAMYGVIFGMILNTSRGIDNFLGYLVLGVMFMRMLSRGLRDGANIIPGSRSLIRSFAFPRASLVLSSGLRGVLDSIAPAIVAVLFALGAQLGTPISWKVILVLPLFLLVHLFSTGLSFLIARLSVDFPDIRQLISVLNRAWFYVSGVFFSVDKFDTAPALQAVVEFNPAYVFLNAVRDTVIYDSVPGASTWLYLLAWTFGTLAAGFLVFWQAEEKYSIV